MLSKDGSLITETGWSGSGGGISAYEKQPEYQKGYVITKAGGMRAVPDVSYNADPKSGVSVYASSGKKGYWYVLGGTSAGAPQWAGIKALSLSADNQKFYNDKSSDAHDKYFRDIQTGSNGDCGYFCTARKRYDYVTGLGSPLTSSF
jgi:subtilase family serine protease